MNDGFGQWRDALDAAARLAGWQPRVAASSLSKENIVSGRGIAIGGFASSQAAVVADIEVNRRTGKIMLRHLYGSLVAGFAVYLPGIENQIEGNLIMGASRALHEAVPFNTRRSTALDWVSYPILRFVEAPRVSTTIVQRKDLASTGAGEPPSVAGRGRDRKRLLRRHGRQDHHGADDAGNGSRHSRSRGRSPRCRFRRSRPARRRPR